MDELSRALLHGTAGLDAAEDAASGNLGAALREQAVSEWAADQEPQRRPLSWTDRPLAQPGSGRPLIPYRIQARGAAVFLLAVLIVILVALG